MPSRRAPRSGSTATPSTSARTRVVSGTPQDADTVAAADARGRVRPRRAARGVRGEHVRVHGARARDCCSTVSASPRSAPACAGRHVLVVVRGLDHAKDLKSLKHYIREYKPVLVGVDGGADALLEAGHTPHLIVGDMEAVSDAALATGAEVVVHAYPDGRAPGPGPGPGPRHRRGDLPDLGHQRGRRDAAGRRAGRGPDRRRRAATPPSASSSTRAAPAWPRRS